MNDVETYYERLGDGPPIVFVHASMLDLGMWGAQVRALSDDFTTIAYDLRGHGRTGGSARSEYPMDVYAEDLAALLTALDVDRPVLCGLSMGGMVAQVFAHRYPDRIAGLVLADTLTPEIQSRGEWSLRRVFYPALIPPVRLVGFERAERAKVWLADRFATGASGDYENVERLRDSGPTMTTDEFVKVLRSMIRFHEVPVDHSTTDVPTLVLYGESDLSFVRHCAATLAAALPDVDVDEVPGAGHASNLDNPDYFTGAVRRFSARIRAKETPARSDGTGNSGTEESRP